MSPIPESLFKTLNPIEPRSKNKSSVFNNGHENLKKLFFSPFHIFIPMSFSRERESRIIVIGMSCSSSYFPLMRIRLINWINVNCFPPIFIPISLDSIIKIGLYCNSTYFPLMIHLRLINMMNIRTPSLPPLPLPRSGHSVNPRGVMLASLSGTYLDHPPHPSAHPSTNSPATERRESLRQLQAKGGG